MNPDEYARLHGDPSIRAYILDDDGRPVPVDRFEEWAIWFTAKDRRIATDRVGHVEISTAFLGLSLPGAGPPLLWETIEIDTRGARARALGHYATRAEALAGHAAAVEEARRREP